MVAGTPGQLALISVLQFAERLTDREAADAVRGRIDWKYALGLAPDDPGFDFTVLTGFRARLIEHGLEQKALDLVLARLSELGLLRSGGRARTDSTHVLAAVRTLNRIEFVGETMRAALEAIAAAAPGWLADHIPAEWMKRYGAASGFLPDAPGRGRPRRVGGHDRAGWLSPAGGGCQPGCAGMAA
jgi:hypothetical protein